MSNEMKISRPSQPLDIIHFEVGMILDEVVDQVESRVDGKPLVSREDIASRCIKIKQLQEKANVLKGSMTAAVKDVTNVKNMMNVAMTRYQQLKGSFEVMYPANVNSSSTPEEQLTEEEKRKKNLPHIHQYRVQKEQQRLKRDKMPEAINDRFEYNVPVPILNLKGADHLVASIVPKEFPPELVLRALGSYGLLRTLSLRLQLSPFSSTSFLRGIALKVPNQLTAEIHVVLLRFLFASIYGKNVASRKDRIFSPLAMTEKKSIDRDWIHLDGITWPAFCIDFAEIIYRKFVHNYERFNILFGEDIDGDNQVLTEAGSDDESDAELKTPRRKKARVETNAKFKEVYDIKKFPYYNVLESLRERNYHELSVEQKLDVLEFLLDELLQVPYFSTELDGREYVQLGGTHVYGQNPPVIDPQSIDKRCCLCLVSEGDANCNTCLNYFHRKCVGLSRYVDLGRFTCPECTYFSDSSRYGHPLSGVKTSIDWFSLTDLEYDDLSIPFPFEYNDSIGYDGLDGQLNKLPFNSITKFLVVQGFIFYKLEGNKSNSSDLTPMPPNEVFLLLLALGPVRATKWPWSQIPFNPLLLWPRNPPQELAQTFKDLHLSYMKSCADDTFNPMAYKNSYHDASFPKKVNVLSKITVASDAPFSMTAMKLPRYASVDGAFSQTKRLEYLKPVKHYILSMEEHLCNSRLLSPSWITPYQNNWRRKVENADNVQQLAALIVGLVDESHSRSFLPEWKLGPSSPIPRAEKQARDRDETKYSPLIDGWTEQDELAVKKWINEGVLFSRGCELINKVKRDRKGRVKGQETSETIGIFDQNITESISTNADSVPSSISMPEPLPAEASSEKAKRDRRKSAVTTAESKGGSRRRSGRVLNRSDFQVEYISKYGPQASIGKAACTIDAYAKIAELEVLAKLKEGSEKEIHWVMAGRKLFKPDGSLSPRDMRALGRKGGITKAPFLSYMDTFEVAQPAFCHVWRSRTLDCKSIHELAHQMRILSQHYDLPTIQTCGGLAKRSKNQRLSLAKVVKICLRDPETGLVEYFVQNQSSRSDNKGAWLADEVIDLSAFMALRGDQFDERIAKVNQIDDERKIADNVGQKAEADEQKKENIAQLVQSAKEAVDDWTQKKDAKVKRVEELKLEWKKLEQDLKTNVEDVKTMDKSYKDGMKDSEVRVKPKCAQLNEEYDRILAVHKETWKKIFEAHLQGGPALKESTEKLRAKTVKALKTIEKLLYSLDKTKAPSSAQDFKTLLWEKEKQVCTSIAPENISLFMLENEKAPSVSNHVARRPLPPHLPPQQFRPPPNGFQPPFPRPDQRTNNPGQAPMMPPNPFYFPPHQFPYPSAPNGRPQGGNGMFFPPNGNGFNGMRRS